MHITDITFHRGAGLLRLCTDGAQEGWAAGATAAAAEAIDAVYRPLLLGAPPGNASGSGSACARLAGPPACRPPPGAWSTSPCGICSARPRACRSTGSSAVSATGCPRTCAAPRG